VPGVTPYTILVVDDSAMMRELVFSAVKRLGDVDLAEAGNGAEAVEMLSGGWRPDLIITDLNMPVMDGLVFIQRVRSIVGLEKLPIVVITTERAVEEREQALRFGATAYVNKPIQARAMVDTLKPLLPAR
jgi:two-component system chemotaxis response regulator CheY